MFQSPGEVLLQLGPLTIRWYGVMIALGIFAAYYYAQAEIKRRALPWAKHLDNILLLVVISGIIGARLYYVVFSWSRFAQAPLSIFKIWEGGLAIHGALLGAALALLIYTRWHRLNLLQIFDVYIPGVLLAQGIGRFGNFFNSEAYGGPTNLPWKLFIPQESRLPGYKEFEYFHPTFLYESLWNLTGFILLVWLSRKAKLPPGGLMCVYLMWYSIGRFFIEMLRTDSLMIGSLRVAQLVSILSLFVGIFTLIFLMRRNKMKHT